MTEEKPGTDSDPLPEEPEDEVEEEWEDEAKKPEQKMPRGFYPVLALIGILIILILVLNVPATRASAGSALSGNWTLQSYANATGTLLPVLPGPAVTAWFTEGRVSGSAGCNRYSGTYSVKDLLITVSNPVSTEMFCTGPGVMVQETAYLDDLKNASSFRVGVDFLKIYDRTGKPLLEFGPA